MANDHQSTARDIGDEYVLKCKEHFLTIWRDSQVVEDEDATLLEVCYAVLPFCSQLTSYGRTVLLLHYIPW